MSFAKSGRAALWGAGCTALLLWATACASDEGAARDRGFPSIAAGQGGAAGLVGTPAGIGAGAAGTLAPAGLGGMGAGQAGVGMAGAAAGLAGTGGLGGAAPIAGAAGMGAGAAGMTAGMAASSGTGASGTAAPSGDICERWTADRADLSEGTWSGSVSGCDPGDMTPEARENAHRLVNLYRSMAGLDPIEMTDEGNRLAQGCALLMNANDRISHTPSESWTCYTEEAADTANRSSLSGGPAVASVDGYMIDPGNPTTLGHRRWILSNMLQSIGFGSAGNFSCQYQPAQRPAAGAPAWVAWPPPGEVPIDAFGGRFYSIDQTGWSVQSDSIDLNSADVTITSDGAPLAVEVTPLMRGYGSTYALSILPMGWTTSAGKTYTVTLSGTSTPIEYDVVVVDCP